jgi:hypothetical protein
MTTFSECTTTKSLAKSEKGDTVLSTIDDWAYTGDTQTRAGPQIGVERITQTGTVMAYRYTPDLRMLIRGWQPYRGTFHGKPWGSGNWPASTVFNAAAFQAVVVENETHEAYSQGNNGKSNELLLDEQIP